MSDVINTVLVTGGAGYVGSVLTPKLLQKDFCVKVLDLFWFGEDTLNSEKDNPNLELIKGDICQRDVLEKAMADVDAVIHLACVSNDPSFELNPELSKAINYDAFFDLVDVAKDAGIQRFIYASSSSVYGVKSEFHVTEELPLEPLTDYSKYKALCEEVLLKETSPEFVTLVLRPATVCGMSPRLRLDLTVNILTNHAYQNRLIKVFGGSQLRPNIHIQDMADLYVQALTFPDEKINGKIYNAGYENHSVAEIAQMARSLVGDDVQIERTESDDNRSYHISSEKIKTQLGFKPQHTIEDAIRDLVSAFQHGQAPNSMTDARYFNIKKMQELMPRLPEL